jgi:hypothetical protein
LVSQSLHICNVGTTFSGSKNAINFEFQATSQLLLASGRKYLVEDVRITVLSLKEVPSWKNFLEIRFRDPLRVLPAEPVHCLRQVPLEVKIEPVAQPSGESRVYLSVFFDPRRGTGRRLVGRNKACSLRASGNLPEPVQTCSNLFKPVQTCPPGQSFRGRVGLGLRPAWTSRAGACQWYT